MDIRNPDRLFSGGDLARVAASSGESVRWNTKSTSIARFTPVTTLTEGSPRSRFNTAKEQDPLARSTNTTAGLPSTAGQHALFQRIAIASRVRHREPAHRVFR